MQNLSPISGAALGTLFTFFMTTLGAAVVFLFKGKIKESYQRVFLGFAAGVMVAAAVWSLIMPAVEYAEESGGIGWIPAAGGFIIGAVFFLILDSLMPHLHLGTDNPEGIKSSLKRTTMMVLAVTLHNIPEGMAVGLTFAVALGGDSNVALSAAVALAIGMGIQNFPEGAAISLPLRQEGFSKKRAFLYGSLSGIVEPIAGILTVLVAGAVKPIMPWLLSFAAGAMIFVVVEELIPEANLDEHSNLGTVGFMVGFLVMMVLDIALG